MSLHRNLIHKQLMHSCNIVQLYQVFLYFLLDINECHDSSTCGENQVCFNTAGSYLCECDYGYERDRNSTMISPGVFRGCKGALCMFIHMYAILISKTRHWMC